MRILDSNNIEYSQYEYEANQSLTGEEIASILHEDVNSVFKTLITKGKSNDYYAFMIPVNKELDLKKAAKTVCEKSVEMIPFKDLLKITGYVHGGCSPLGMKKQYPTYIDESALNWDTIYVSAGVRGLQLKLSPKDLSNECQASFVKLV